MPVFLNSSEFRNKYLEFELGIWKLFDYWSLIIEILSFLFGFSFKTYDGNQSENNHKPYQHQHIRHHGIKIAAEDQ